MKNKRLFSVYVLIVLILLAYGLHQQQRHIENVQQKKPSVVVYKITQKKVDPRALRVYTFLSKYNSPLQDCAVDFVETADKYGINYKVLVAISGVESTFGKNIKEGSYNSFGYMCETSVCNFSSHQEAIKAVAKTISRNRAYIKYRQTNKIYDLALVYNYVYPKEWTDNLNYFIDRI